VKDPGQIVLFRFSALRTEEDECRSNQSLGGCGGRTPWGKNWKDQPRSDAADSKAARGVAWRRQEELSGAVVAA